MNLLTPEGVRSAAVVLHGVAGTTPVFRSRTLDARLGGRLFFKGEHLQRGGSFKFRGAFHALSRLDVTTRSRGVLTYSSGNHAAGLALAGRILGVPVTVAMPGNAIPLKRRATESYGADIVECEAAARETVGRRVAAERGLTVIPPYDHEAIIAGQGTAAMELLAEVPDLEMLVAPVGGGGLLAGTALAAAGRSPRPRVYGVEPELGDDAARSLRTGAIVTLERVPETVADGLRTRFVGERNFMVMRKWVDGIETVTEEEIVRALRWLWIRMKLVVEPSGAVPLAGILSGKLDVRNRNVGVILSGGNAEPDRIAQLLGSCAEDPA